MILFAAYTAAKLPMIFIGLDNSKHFPFSWRDMDRFFRFLTFYPFADEKLIVSSYFIVEKRFFRGDI